MKLLHALTPNSPFPHLPLQRYCVSIYVLVNGLGKWGTILLGNVGGGMVSGSELHELTLQAADTDRKRTLALTCPRFTFWLNSKDPK